MRNLTIVTVAAVSVFAGFAAPASAQQAAGSFQRSCRNQQVAGGTLSAECADTAGRFHTTSIPFTQCHGDIGNNNGTLNCSGSTGVAGPVVGANAPPAGQQGQQQQGGYNGRAGGGQGGPQQGGGYQQQQGGYAGGQGGPGPGQRGGYNGGERRDDNGALIAGLAGLAAGLYAPGYAYPSYGDPRYGDPRFDPRYAQGGYAYGQPRGAWVPIEDRAQWLDQRIDRGVREGSLDRGDVARLRRGLMDIETLERSYRRRGLQTWMRADLDKRFDQLAARIQYARNDGAGRGDGYRGDDRYGR